MKKVLVFLLAVLMIMSFAFAFACGEQSNQGGTTNTEQSGTPSGGQTGGTEQSGTQQSQLKDITDITFNGATYDYDGNEKVITVTGNLPNGVSAEYKNNKGTDAGEYSATATLSGEGYKQLVLNAKLVINKIAMTGLFFDGDSVEYDAKEHSVYLQGNPPQGATVTYTYDGIEQTGVTEVGSHTVKVTVTHKNYMEYTATVKLTIKSTEKFLSSVYCNGAVYFQNDLDGEALYKASGSSLTKINSDAATNMSAYGNSVFYVNEGILSSSVKSLAADSSSATKIINAAAESLAFDGTYLYYSVNNILINTSVNGIYKIKADGTEESAVRLTTDKADYLTYCNGYLYYSNLSEGKKLYKISVNATETKGTLLDEEKVSYITEDNGVLYYNSAKTVGAAVSKYTISTGKKVKLTTDAGKYLVKLGDYIYYVNSDWLTSSLFGDGIYKVSANKTEDSSLSGTKVLSAETDGYSSLMSDGTYLYYYKLNDKHFYRYNLTSNTETDLMATFTPPKATLGGYANMYAYNGELYYTDPTDGGCLYKYNPTTKSKSKVVADNVAGAWYSDNYLYYSTYLLTNYALWRTNLDTNETTKISSDRLDHLTFDGDTVYCIKVGSVYNNHIYKMNKDGTGLTEVYGKDNLWVADFIKSGDYIYYARNPKLYAERLSRYSISENETVVLNDNIKAKAFTIDGDKIYVAGADDKLYVMNIDGTSESVIASKVTVNDLIVKDGKLYYSSTNASNTGFYCYDIATGKTTKINNTNAHGFTVCDGKLYFIQTAIEYTTDYPYNKGSADNDGKVYCYDGSKITKVA